MNEQTRTILFNVVGILILMGAVMHFFHWVAAPYLFAVGAAGYAINYLTMKTQEMDFRARRLHRFNVLSGLLMIFASGLMFKGGNEWVICLTIGAIFQMYTAFVSPK